MDDALKRFIEEKVEEGFLFVLNHSAGKDSQAMTAVMRKYVPDDQILVVHAHLGDVEWHGVIDHIEATTKGLEMRTCRSRRDLMQMVEERGMFPSPQQRQCTSDLKRGPIERTIRQHLCENPRFDGKIVNCMGLRAAESANRAKQKTIKFSDRNSKAGREWYDLLPIHDMSIDDVWLTIANAGQQPHPAYGLGMTRLSCVFCIMASDADLRTAAINKPELYARYVALEKKIGRTMMMPRGGVALGLEEITGVTVEDALARRFETPAPESEEPRALACM